LPVPTATFLFTDIEGSTALLQRVGDEIFAQLLASHHALIRSALAAHHGTEVDTAGDGFFAVFSSPRDCMAAALQAQHALQDYPWPGAEHVRVRMGVHSGEASRAGAGWVGLDVHRAARIAAVGYGGQVLVSEAAAVLARSGLPAGITLRDLGVHQLKDLGSGERIYQLCAAGLQPEFGPLRSLGNPALRHNLPAQPTPFIGRDRELAEVASLVESSRLVTLTGAGGCGKTRLGLQVAADLLDGSGDGVWLVELAPLTSDDDVATAVCQTLRIRAQPGRTSLDVLADTLALQDILIVLDNCEHLIGGCAKTADILLRRCPRVHLIATSREPLGIAGEVIYRAPSLSLPAANDPDPAAAAASDAVALFTDRARAQGIDLAAGDETTGQLAVSVCQQLDGLPLAIELAAARLRSMSLGELHARLDQRFRLLTGGSRAALERQQTLRATVGWSYVLLNPAEQALLRRLSIFAGSFDLAAAEAVGRSDDIHFAEVADLLGSLVDKSLVTAGQAGSAYRYRLLETIRQFAAEHLADTADEAPAAAAAHCAYYLAVAETTRPHVYGPDQGQWLTRLDADQANLRRAAQYAASQPDGTVLFLRFAVALNRYWKLRSLHEEAALLVRVLQGAEVANDPALFAEALVAGADLTAGSDLSVSTRLARQAHEVASGLGDDKLLAMACGMLGATYCFAGDGDRARQLAGEAVEGARQLGDDVLLGICLLQYAHAVGVVAAGPVLAEAIACTERSGDLLINGYLHNSAGVGAVTMGDIPAARAHLEAAIRVAESIGDPHPLQSGNLAWVLRAEHDLNGARTMLHEALSTGRRIGDRYTMADAVFGLACLATDLADWHRAAMLHGAAQALLDQTGGVWDEDNARYRQESLHEIAAALGDEQVEQDYARGMALGFDQAVDLALGRASAA
jgi:predicted ATPase/class 3 adenylate cyclase